MTHSAKSVFAFGSYMFGQGLILLVAPAVLLKLLGLPEATEPWPRVVGIALVVLGLYYVLAARGNWVPFFKATLIGRTVQLVCFIALVTAGVAPAILLGTAGLEFAAAVWTFLALKAERQL
jgi:hypothetical protein